MTRDEIIAAAQRAGADAVPYEMSQAYRDCLGVAARRAVELMEQERAPVTIKRLTEEEIVEAWGGATVARYNPPPTGFARRIESAIARKNGAGIEGEEPR